ncbi:hypothetical protein, partial [Brucella rhizosphaerae]|uniref:hypothetical protein n=1 Tax=Brucella rhizosphaerae TaxID=571254 RepID=UPI001AEBB796
SFHSENQTILPNINQPSHSDSMPDNQKGDKPSHPQRPYISAPSEPRGRNQSQAAFPVVKLSLD